MSESKISCPHCSQHISLDSSWSGQLLNCPVCHKPFTVPQFGPAAPAPAGGGLRLNTTATQPPPPLAPASAPSAAAGAPARPCGLAIASLVLSLLGCFFLTAIAGVICGHLARKRIRQNPALSGGGLALAGLIIGYLMIALSVGGGIKFALDVKNKVNEIKAQRSGQPVPDSAPTAPVAGGSVGAKVRSAIPAPADAVSGTVKGQPFKYTRSSLAQGTGSLDIDGREFATEGYIVTIFLTSKRGESLENRTWHITPTMAPGTAPSIFIIKLHAGSSTKDIIRNGYEMDLTTGPITGGVRTEFGGVSRIMGGQIAGTITLKISGAAPVDIKGNFAATAD